MHASCLAATLCGLVLILIVPSCRPIDEGGPPVIMLGDSICSECGMIISDERFATATVVKSEGGQEALIFDDLICQVRFEKEFQETDIANRWSHDYLNKQWIPTESSWFVRSTEIHSPMASGVVIFQNRADAEAFAKPINGELSDFETAWTTLE